MSTDLLVLFALWCFALFCFGFGWMMCAALTAAKIADKHERRRESLVTCGRCKRTISRKDVESGNYSRSAFSRLNYCNKRSCKTVDPADKVRRWGATRRDDLK